MYMTSILPLFTGDSGLTTPSTQETVKQALPYYDQSGMRDFYPCAVCAGVKRLSRLYVSSKNTAVCVLPLENHHKKDLCCSVSEFIDL